MFGKDTALEQHVWRYSVKSQLTMEKLFKWYWNYIITYVEWYVVIVATYERDRFQQVGFFFLVVCERCNKRVIHVLIKLRLSVRNQKENC